LSEPARSRSRAQAPSPALSLERSQERSLKGAPVQPASGETTSTPLLHGLAPVVGPATRLMVLGSFPSVASLAAQQYYAHPRNQFWPLLSALWGVDLRALPYAERLAVVRQRGLGIWDVYAHCRREGSLDSAIQDAQLNDLASLRQQAPQLAAVAHNGGESARVMRHTRALGWAVHRLPSTSPANASWSFERKLLAWREVFAHYDLI
jgi:hypoxanthine-DNA glycosylase